MFYTIQTKLWSKVNGNGTNEYGSCLAFLASIWFLPLRIHHWTLQTKYKTRKSTKQAMEHNFHSKWSSSTNGILHDWQLKQSSDCTLLQILQSFSATASPDLGMVQLVTLWNSKPQYMGGWQQFDCLHENKYV